jgi:hypothetical protein
MSKLLGLCHVIVITVCDDENKTWLILLEPSSLCVQTGSRAHPSSCTMGTGGPFPGGKERPGRHSDHSPESSAEVKNQELYLLSPQAPSWSVTGLLSELDIDNVRLSLLIKVSRLDCSLFYDAFSVTKTYIASNKRVTSKL